MIFYIYFIFISMMPSVDKTTIEGTITDTKGAPLSGASISTTDFRQGTAADADGYFVLHLTEASASVKVLVSYVGYRSKTIEIDLPAAGPITISLKEDPLQQDDVLITASPSGSNRSYRPTSATTLAQLQERATDNFGDALLFEPGVSVRSFGSAPSRPVIRGFDGNRVLMLENGERMGDLGETAPDHATSLDVDAAERIEIIRGPASFLYGSGAIGGVVNVFNNDIPTMWAPGMSGRFSATGMSVSEGGAGFGRVTYGTETVAVTSRISYRNTGDIRSPSGIVPDTFNEVLSGGLGFAFRNPGFVGGLSVSGLDQTYGLPEEIEDPDETIEIRLNRLNIGGYGQFANTGVFDQAQLRFNLSRYGHKEIEVERLPDGAVDEDIEIEFRTLTFSGSMMLVRSQQEQQISGALGTSTSMRMLNVGGEEGLTPDGRNLNAALFGYVDVPLYEALSFQSGLRADYNFMETFANSRFDTPESPTRSDVSVSGSLGLNLKTSAGLETGIQLARSFRTPSIEELFTDAAHIGAGAYEVGDPDLNNEIGYGLDLFGLYSAANVSLELSTFYYLIQDFIYYQPTEATDAPSGLPVFEVQADNARYYGFEADLTINPFRHLSLNAGLDYVRAQRLDDSSHLPFIPPMRGRARLSFDRARWNIGSEFIHSLKQDRVIQNEQASESHTLVNLFAGFRIDAGGRHLLTLRADNLLNESYRNHLSRVDGGAFRNPMPGRGFTTRYQYIF